MGRFNIFQKVSQAPTNPIQPAAPRVFSALQKSVTELRQGIDMHTCLIASMLESEVDDRSLKPFLSACSAQYRERRMKAAIQDAIDALEESRKAFKSKRLEALRKQLTQVLVDTQ